jgi:hypothetical protein
MCPVPSVAVKMEGTARQPLVRASIGLTKGLTPCRWPASLCIEQQQLNGSVAALSSSMTEAAKPSGSWTDAFPAPRTTAPILTREEALSSLSSPDLLIVDVRRTDYEGGTIKGSINLPAHSFYLNRGVLYDLCKRADVKKVAFYCGRSVRWVSLIQMA